MRRFNVHLQNGASLNLVSSTGEKKLWQATTDDPQFQIVRPRGGTSFSAGWYLVECALWATEGAIVSPCLYPDYGNGLSELDRIELGVDWSKRAISAVVLLKQNAHSLRFDPSMRECTFSVGPVTFKKMGRLQCLYQMAKTASIIRNNSIHENLQNLLECFLRRFRHEGLRSAGEAVHKQYVEMITHGRTNSYQTWVQQFDSGHSSPTMARASFTEQKHDAPLISVIIPTYETPERWLRLCLDSVLRQSYERWELCVADDCSTAPHVRRVLNEYAAKDNRIRVNFRTSRGHIAGASNTALEMARGELVALLDHDDELSGDALLEVAAALRDKPDLKLIYSDEDKIDVDGQRFDPYFKPDWNYELLLAQNCISHLGVFDRKLLLEIGGFRAEFSGSQDWDLALRCIERISAHQIHHIPRVLYHWRAAEGSTAKGVGEKNYALEAALQAVQEHFLRTGTDATAHIMPGSGYLRVLRASPVPEPLVSIIIPTRDRLDLLQACIESVIEKTHYKNYEIVIIDNQSREPKTLEYFEKLSGNKKARVLKYDAEFNYSKINNFAAKKAKGEYLVLLNNDVEIISSGWLQEMMGHACRPEVGAVGALLLFPNDTIQHAGVVLGVRGVAAHCYSGKPGNWAGQMGRAQIAQEMSAVTAACLLVRKSAYLEVGGLNVDLKIAFNDIDFCLRLRNAGYKNIWTPHARLYHKESASRGYEDTPEKMQRFLTEVDYMKQNWGDILAADPSYNPNLSFENDDFSLAFPPRYRPSRSEPSADLPQEKGR